MRKLRIYLDTSIINFLFAQDAGEYMSITKNFFDNYLNDYEVFISEIVYVEVNRTKDEKKRALLLSAIQRYQSVNREVEELARKYVEADIIARKKFDDALHIAFATHYEFDVLLSWNFKHLANIKKQMAVNSLNEREGYSKKLNLLNPMEVIYEK